MLAVQLTVVIFHGFSLPEIKIFLILIIILIFIICIIVGIYVCAVCKHMCTFVCNNPCSYECMNVCACNVQVLCMYGRGLCVQAYLRFLFLYLGVYPCIAL